MTTPETTEWSIDQITPHLDQVPDHLIMDVFREVLARVPEQKIIDGALRAVMGETDRRAEQQRSYDRANELATQYHTAVGGDVWVQPVAEFAAYPTGWETTHNGSRWVVVAPHPTMHEPGTSDDWAETSPEVTE